MQDDLVTVAAQPFPYVFPAHRVALLVIDMQRDFVEPGGFGETLGNDVRRLQAIVPMVAKLIALFRRCRWPVIHTREGHRPDLADCPPAKRGRGSPSLRIGDEGPMGRILIHGEKGHALIPECSPVEGRLDRPFPGAWRSRRGEAPCRRALRPKPISRQWRERSTSRSRPSGGRGLRAIS
jgi:biuret amidohydrolase